jgi:hypothetical protein
MTGKRNWRERHVGPLRVILGDVVGSDGLVYDRLDCTHRLPVMPSDYKRGFEFKRHCWLCGQFSKTALITH